MPPDASTPADPPSGDDDADDNSQEGGRRRRRRWPKGVEGSTDAVADVSPVRPGGAEGGRWRQLLQAINDADSGDLPTIGGNQSAGGAVPSAPLPQAQAIAACTIPDDVGTCEVYRLQYVASHWGSFVLVLLIDGEQAAQSPFRPFVFPPPDYPWFNSSSLQVLPSGHLHCTFCGIGGWLVHGL